MAAPCAPKSPPDTVSALHASSQSWYRTNDPTEGRRMIPGDLKHYNQALGSAAESEISALRAKLTDAQLLYRTRWSSFTPVDLERSNESTFFQPLDAIISKIFKQQQDCSFYYAASPSQRPASSRGNSSRPDAYIVRSPHFEGESEQVHWFDIAIPFEFKKSPSDAFDNEQKIIWSLHNIMREDPLRRFALGVTIEHPHLKVWHISRSLLTVTEAINFTTEIDRVISFFYLISKQTEVQLGWDPTVKRVKVNDKIQYKFEVDGHSFTTTRELATYGADAMVGCGTRVYEAIDETGKPVVVKDSWRDKGRDKEGDIIHSILRDIQTKVGDAAAAHARDLFVRVRVYGDVPISPSEGVDETLHPGEDGSWVEIDIDSATLSSIRHSPSVGHIPGADHSEVLRRSSLRLSRVITRRVHTRTVFEDVGMPLMKVSSLVDGLSCLNSALLALYYVHKAGWVHRDFSVATVVWDKGGGVGKLTGFGYAKKSDSTVSHEGPMHFMAVEVEKQRYLFRPGKVGVLSNDSSIKLFTILNNHLSTMEGLFKGTGSDPPFLMNFLHDLESLWWATMWFLLYSTSANSPTEDLEGQWKSFDEAFPSSIGSASRFFFFNDAAEQLRACGTLSEAYRDRCRPVAVLGTVLKASYQQLEAKFPELSFNDWTLLEEVYGLMKMTYRDVVEHLKEGPDVVLQPLSKVDERKRGSADLPTHRAGKKARQK